jgi:hypothetical protein
VAREPVTVILNNRDLLMWPRAMIESIERFEDLAEILIVDNGSTYEPLLQYYKSQPHEVLYLDNLGHKAPWTEKVKRRLKTALYVVSDPDLDLSGTPRDCLAHLAHCLRKFPQAGKIGLGLTFDDVPPQSPYYRHVNTFEKSYWDLPVYENLVRPAAVDTTFAIYDTSLLHEYRICGGRTNVPYTARHLPWSVVTPDAEFRYYLERANASSSYTWFVKGNANP